MSSERSDRLRGDGEAAAAFAVLWRVEATNAGACDFSGETALVRRALISLFFATNPVQQQTWTRCDSDGEDGALCVLEELCRQGRRREGTVRVSLGSLGCVQRI